MRIAEDVRVCAYEWTWPNTDMTIIKVDAERYTFGSDSSHVVLNLHASLQYVQVLEMFAAM
jgi:hypothetical protein